MKNLQRKKGRRDREKGSRSGKREEGERSGWKGHREAEGKGKTRKKENATTNLQIF